MECEYFPEYIPRLKGVIEEYQLDYTTFDNHYFYTDEKFPYLGRNTHMVDILELYGRNMIEGMESGSFIYLTHPGLFMRSYPGFDRHCRFASKRICRTAARLNLPLERNIGYKDYNDEHGITTIPHLAFWEMAVHEGRAAIIGANTHNNQYLETSFYYDRTSETLQKLGVKMADRVPFPNER